MLGLQAATGTRHNLHHTVLTGFPVIAFALLSWIILLAGVSALQSSCNSEGYASVGTVLPALSCGKAYKYQWWVPANACGCLALYDLTAVTATPAAAQQPTAEVVRQDAANHGDVCSVLQVEDTLAAVCCPGYASGMLFSSLSMLSRC